METRFVASPLLTLNYPPVISAGQLAKGFQLAAWTVRPEDGSLSRAGSVTRLEPLPMDLLVFLCSRARQVVSRQEILERVWRGRFVSDDTVKAAFYQLRKALGDSPRKPRFIETLPKRGYRFLVEPVPLEPPPAGSGHGERLFARGKALLAGQPDAAALKQARLYFERALEAQPEHAAAAAALAHVYIHLIAAGLANGSELFPRVQTLAARALALDPRLASAHVARGVAQLLYGRDCAAAEESFHAALALDPVSLAARRWYARLLSFENRHQEALAEIRRALAADPLSLAVRRDWIEALSMARAYREALAEAQQSLRMAGHAPDLHLGMAWIYFLLGDERQAYEAAQAGFRSLGAAPEVLRHLTRAFERGGMRETLRLWARTLEEQAALGQKAIDLPILYALLDDKDRAFALIDPILRQSHPALLWLPVSPFFDNLRSDPRYPKMLARLRTPEP